MTILTPDAPLRLGWKPNVDLRRPGLIGATGLLVLIGVLGLWAAITVIGGAVIANGQTVVRGKPQLVQSLDGGVVEMIAVRNGDVVSAGQVLVRLDPTLLASNRDIAMGRLTAALALKTRLEGEQLGLQSLSFTPAALPFAVPPSPVHEAGQRAIFAARLAVRQGTRDQLAEALVDFDTQTEGVASQIAALRDQMRYLDGDLENLRTLTSEGLARQSQMSEMQRSAAELEGRLAALQTEQARLASARRDSELKTLQTERGFMEAVVTELREVTTKTEELTLEIVTRNAQLDRIEIRAPAAGIVHEIQVATVGGVIAPGAVILQVLPLEEGLDFELRVDPRAIDQVHPGQTAQIRLASFDPQTTPKLAARVSSISPGAITDPQTGQSFYRVSLAVDPVELARLGDTDLMPGMPVEAYLETGDRTVLAYLLQPISTTLRRAFRE